MSKLRKDKNCLNCGTTVEDTYCSHCGQKNIQVHVNAFHAIGEFIADYFHADGKFFSSIIPLLFRPGKMTIEYNAGRRMKYIHPFRLYIFISIVFFFISLSRATEMTLGTRDAEGRVLTVDSLDTVLDSLRTDGGFKFTIPKNLQTSLQAYKDSINNLPEDRKPGFIEDFISQRIVRGMEMGTKRFFEEWQRKFFHNIPTMMFFLLPLVALILKLLYIRRKKYYIDHLIFSIHVHSFVFILLIIATLIHIAGNHNEGINALVFFISLFYLFVALKKVYQQGYFKTMFKFFSFLFLYLIAFCAIFLINLIYTTANT